MSKSTMPKIVSALTARTQFGQILRRASEKNERFLVGRRGNPKVVIMGLRDYIDTIAPAPDWLKKSWTDAKRKGLNKLSMQAIDAEIRAYRREQRQAGKGRRPR